MTRYKVCVCGHKDAEHAQGCRGYCTHWTYLSIFGGKTCPCWKFREGPR